MNDNIICDAFYLNMLPTKWKKFYIRLEFEISGIDKFWMNEKNFAPQKKRNEKEIRWIYIYIKKLGCWFIDWSIY